MTTGNVMTTDRPRPSEPVREKGRIMVLALAVVAVLDAVIAGLAVVGGAFQGWDPTDAIALIAGLNAAIIAAAAAVEKALTEWQRAHVWAPETVQWEKDELEGAVLEGVPEDGEPPGETDPAQIEAMTESWDDDYDIPRPTT